MTESKVTALGVDTSKLDLLLNLRSIEMSDRGFRSNNK